MNQPNLKDTIIMAWLDLDPDLLAAEMPVEVIPRSLRDEEGNDVIKELPYLSWRAVAEYNERVYEAFGAYKGAHTTDLPGYVYEYDWDEFLYALREARKIASDPLWEAPRDGVVYRNLA